MKDKYPTWHRVDAHLIVSEEQRDGTPDFYVEKEHRGRWYVKWRTSAHWSGPYKTSAEAMRNVEDNFKQQMKGN